MTASEVTVRPGGRTVTMLGPCWTCGRTRAAGLRSARTPRRACCALIEREADALLVAVDQGHVVGALIAAWDGRRASMYRLAVLPKYRRRGIGRRPQALRALRPAAGLNVSDADELDALVDAGHERLRAKGAPRVTAMVAHDEEDAVGLWLAAGYARDEDVVRFVRNL